MNNNFFSGLKSGVLDKVKLMQVKEFHPTGILEPVIKAVGDTKTIHTIVNSQGNNKGGKTALGAVILRNIIWEYDPIYFNFKNFVQWPFIDNDGNPIKRIRIVGTASNVANDGPIRLEILKWWPRGRYEELKAGQTYFSKYVTDTGWLVDVMTFNQSPDQFEGPLISFHWVDEPAKPDLIGAFTSRWSKGGIILFTQTPINAGPMLDILGDLKDKGTNVIKISSKLDDNSITSGKLNSTGKMRGLMTDEEIKSYKITCPPEEYDSRVNGIGSEKEGKVYKHFNRSVHVRDFDIEDPRFKAGNCYCALDMHEKYYPFITWWAIFPPNEVGKSYHVCYNEWPTKDTFGEYYHNMRMKADFNMTIENLSKIIKMLDYTQYGYNIVKRGIDPGFAKKNDIALEFTKYSIQFDIPKREKIQTQRNNILTMMQYDNTLGNFNIYTEPQWFIMPHCKNTIISFDRHYWEDKESVKASRKNIDGLEAERYKDPVDTARIFESMAVEYFQVLPGNRRVIKKPRPSVNIEDEYLAEMTDICLYR